MVFYIPLEIFSFNKFGGKDDEMEMIPISERLPKTEDLDQYKCVLTQLKCGGFYVTTFDTSDPEVSPFRNQEDYFEGDSVVSWCRLPSVEQEEVSRQYFYSFNIIRDARIIGHGSGGVLKVPSEAYQAVKSDFEDHNLTIESDVMQLLAFNPVD